MAIPYKVHFRIERGDDRTPPVAAETVQTRPTDGSANVVDDLPLFARAATLGDTIKIQVERGALWYRATVKS